MKLLQPVIWSKGTFLSSQHLQTQDRYVESLLKFRLDALSFRPWGFTELKVSQEALAAGNLAIASASGIFPDGLAFDIPGSDPVPPPKALKPHFEKEQESLEAYLAVPGYRERGMNVGLNKQGADARYVPEIVMRRDENAGAQEKPVQVARKNFRLLVSGESLQGTSALRIARIKIVPDGSYQLDAQSVPPLLNIAASDYLVDILRRLVEIIAAKSSTLAGMRREKKQGLADFTAADVANFWLLYTINSSFPVLRHLFETRRGHPETLYAAMNALAGALTTFSARIQPRDLPAYDHDELGACFTSLDVKLREMLETVVPTNCVSLPLKPIGLSIHATALADDRYFRNTRMFLAIRAEMKVADLIQKAPNLIKVSAGTRVENLIKHAMPGIKLVHTPQPPGGIPVKLNYEYFALNQSGEDWDAVGLSRNLAAHVPGDIPNPQLELIVLLPQAI